MDEPHRYRSTRLVALAAGILSVFAAAAIIFSRVIPGPLTATDYLVIGTAATFAALVTLFAILLKNWVKTPDLLYKRRRR